MDQLAFLLRLIGVTARVGGIVALAALVIATLVQIRIEPFADLAGTTLYQTVIVAGIIGFSTVAVEIGIASVRFINSRIKTRLVFIEQPGAFWSYVEKDGVLQLHAVLHVSNRQPEDRIISRPRVCVSRLGRKREWQECFQLEVGGEILVPGMIGARLPSRTMSVVIVRQIHRMTKPPLRSLFFDLEFRDQCRRRHRTRLSADFRPTPLVTARAVAG